MALNNYFQNYEGSGEQKLIEELILESIKIYGIETYYLPRTLINQDDLFFEDTLRKFDDNYIIEMYVKNVEGYEGEGELLSRFGLEIRDQMTLTVSKRRFQEEITEMESDITRPREGDVIYLPMIKGALPDARGALFEIKHVVKESIFYQLGDLQTFDITVEKFTYSDERLDTGISEIDNVEVDYSQSYALADFMLATSGNVVITTSDGVPLVRDSYDKGTIDRIDTSTLFQSNGATFIDFSEINPFSENNF